MSAKEQTTEAYEAAQAALDHFEKRDDVYWARVKTLAEPGFQTNHIVKIEFDEGTPFRTFDAVAAGFEALDASVVKQRDGILLVEGHYHDSDWDYRWSR